jgi:small subunit ribosomal protein S7
MASPAGGMDLPPSMTFRDIPHEMAGKGHKFGLPDTPLARTDHFKRRYDPVVDQLTKALMRDGKLSAAQRV